MRYHLLGISKIGISSPNINSKAYFPTDKINKEDIMKGIKDAAHMP